MQSVGRRTIGIIIVGFLIVLASSAVKNLVSVYFVPMASSFKASLGTFGIPVTIFMLAYAVASPTMGYCSDRFGVRWVMSAGVALIAVLLAAAALSHVFVLFILIYGIGLAFGYAAVSFTPLGVLVSNTFPPDRRGLFYALLTNGTAAGFVVLSPLWEVSSTHHVSWRSLYLILAVVFLLLIWPALRWIPVPAAAGHVRTADRPPLGAQVRTILKNRTFRIVSLSFVGCGVSMAFIDVSMVADMNDNMVPPAAISAALVALGIAEIVGAVLAGRLSDRGIMSQVLVVCYLLRAVSLAILLFEPTAIGSVSFAALFGVSYMGTVIVSTMYVVEAFDEHTKGLALGMMWLGHQVGAALSAESGAISYDLTGSYNVIIVAVAIVTIISAATIAAAPPSRPGAEPAKQLSHLWPQSPEGDGLS